MHGKGSFHLYAKNKNSKVNSFGSEGLKKCLVLNKHSDVLEQPIIVLP